MNPACPLQGIVPTAAPVFDPNTGVANCVAWVQANLAVNTSGAASSCPDSITGLSDWTQGTAAARILLAGSGTGQYFTFGGVSRNLQRSGNSGTLHATGDYTHVVRVRGTETASSRTPSIGASGSALVWGPVHLEQATDATQCYRGGNTATVAGEFASNVWHTLALVKSGGVHAFIRIVNGVTTNIGSASPGGTVTSTSLWIIGGHSTFPASGDMSVAAIYSRALTQAEIETVSAGMVQRGTY